MLVQGSAARKTFESNFKQDVASALNTSTTRMLNTEGGPVDNIHGSSNKMHVFYVYTKYVYSFFLF